VRQLATLAALAALSTSVFAQDAPDPLALATEAKAAMEGKNYNDALSKIEQLIKAFPTPDANQKLALESIYFWKGSALYNLKQYDNALKALQQFQQLYPSSKSRIDASFFIANCYISLKKEGEAVSELKKLEADPALRDESLLLQAQIAYQQKKFKEAVAPLQKLTEGNLTSDMALQAAVMLGSVYTQIGQFDKATDVMQKIRRNFILVENKAIFNATVLDLAEKLFNAGLLREAQQIYQMVQSKEELLKAQEEAALQNKAKIAEAQDNLKAAPDDQKQKYARIGERLTKNAEQIKAGKEEINKLPPFMPNVLLRRAKAYSDLGRLRESVIVYDYLIESFPEAKKERDIAAYSKLLAYVDLKKTDEALKAAAFYLEKFPDGDQRDMVTYLRGSLCLDANDPKKAVTFFGQAIANADERMKKSPLFPRMVFLLAVSKFALQEFSESAKSFQEYLTKYPKSEFEEEAKYRIALATLFGNVEVGYKQAIGLFNDYIKSYPNGLYVPDAKYRIAVCKRTAKENDKVVADCDSWLREYPNDQMIGEILALKADALVDLKNTKEAAQAYKESALRASSDEVINYSITEASKLFQDQGDWNSMNEMWKKFVETHPKHQLATAAYFYIGQSMTKSGKIQEGKDYIAGKIRENISDPHNEIVERLISQLIALCVKKPKVPPGWNAAPPPTPIPTPVPETSGDSSEPTPTPAPPPPRPRIDPSIEVNEILATFPDTPASKARKLFALSEMEMMRRKPEESAKYLNQIADTAKAEALSPLLLGKVGDILLDRKDYGKARTMFEQITGAFPTSEYLDYGYVGLGELAMRTRKFDEAFKQFDKACKLENASSKVREANLGRALALYELKKYAEATKEFEIISGTKEWKGEATAISLLYLGRIAMNSARDYPKAIAYYQRVYLTQQRYPKIVAQAYMESADAFRQLGKVKEQRNTYAEMLRNEKLKKAQVPELEEAKKKLDQLGGEPEPEPESTTESAKESEKPKAK